MDNTEVIERLSELIQLEFDAVKIYDEAIKGVDDPVIRDRLNEFKQAHDIHIGNLSRELQGLGQKPPYPIQGMKGTISERAAMVRSMTGIEGTLKVVGTVEKKVSRHYRKLVPTDMPMVVSSILKRHLSDEKVHLEYIDLNIQSL